MSVALSNAGETGQTLRGQSKVSPTAFTVGFFFSFRSALAMISARALGVGSEPGVIAMFVIECALLVTIMLQAAGPAGRPLSWLTQQSSMRWVSLFLAFSCTSLLWSAAVSRPASFLYWCALAADVAMVALLLRGGVVSEISSSIMRGFIGSTCVLACIAWMLPAASDLRLGDPEYFNTNQIGNLCALAVFMVQLLAGSGGAQRRGAICFLTVTLLRSLSKTTIIAFALAEAILMFHDTSMTRKKKIAAVCAAVILMWAYWGLTGSYLDDYASGSEAQSLTGRTGIWAFTLGEALDKPWFGNGMDAMWKVFPPFGRDMFEARHAENEVLQQFFAYGLTGIAMLAGIYASLWRRIVTLRTGPLKAVLNAMMVFVVVRGLAEAEPFDLLLPLWMITLISGIVTEGQGVRDLRLHEPAGFSSALSGAEVIGSSAI